MPVTTLRVGQCCGVAHVFIPQVSKEAPPAPKSKIGLYVGLGAVILGAGVAYYLYDRAWFGSCSHFVFVDGSFGLVVLRSAWHASGTYDKATGTGGSNYATMRF
ncbi:hypothetical protein EV702DRAFT_1274485 [Suillus placidus]|uniref:Transmembrane protein n=1 Tax=Suillus placidus TaxID=48579 RepID=A0A9P7A5V0_9AGAM|nr:hypothetical protein EV702DRAFT_1274485 [Suillus placidus]